MQRVDITPSAGRDLLEIWDYIATDSADAADRVIANIRSEFQKLADMPGMGHTRPELAGIYRVWAIYSYLIIYRRETQPIQIIRVVSGFRNLQRLTF